MARYFRNLNKGYVEGSSYPSYAVVHDTPEESNNPRVAPRYAYGYANLYHTPSKEQPNFKGEVMKPGATELFTHKPAELHVNLMYADKRVRPHMMTLMALAKLDHPDAQIVAPDTLSNFSSKLAKNAHERGLIKPSFENPDMSTDDDTDHPDEYVRQVANLPNIKNMVLGNGGHELTRAEVMKGKQFLKETLRPRKEETAPAPQSDQPRLHQPRLPGM
jgi:hypothetical protein